MEGGGALPPAADDRAAARLRAWVVARLDPRAAKELGRRAGQAPALVIARFLTPGTRERLREAHVGYVDSTGNAYIALNRPALFIETTGARTDPTPKASVVTRLEAQVGYQARSATGGQ